MIRFQLFRGIYKNLLKDGYFAYQDNKSWVVIFIYYYYLRRMLFFKPDVIQIDNVTSGNWFLINFYKRKTKIKD
jgi:hypothetical protein